jgi:hypothetical protein
MLTTHSYVSDMPWYSNVSATVLTRIITKIKFLNHSEFTINLQEATAEDNYELIAFPTSTVEQSRRSKVDSPGDSAYIQAVPIVFLFSLLRLPSATRASIS